jgi:hypothetical protein
MRGGTKSKLSADLFSGTVDERSGFGRYLRVGIEIFATMLEFIDIIQMKRKIHRTLVNAFFIIRY